MTYTTPELRRIGNAKALVLANESLPNTCFTPDSVVGKSFLAELW
jgi:hypothetical protein